MGYKRYFKRVDAISMELRDTQRDLSVIGKKSREIDSIISSEHEGVSATFLKIDSIGEDISVIRERMGDILKALDATKKPCNKDLKQYHQGLKNLVEIISENPNYMVFDDDLIKIVFENEIKTITLEKLKEYETFLLDVEQIRNYLSSLDMFYRSYRFRILGRNFYAYSLKDYNYKDKKNKTIYTSMVEKREILRDDVDEEYIDKLRKKILLFEEKIKDIISSLIKTRKDFELYLAVKKAK